ncbi:MAG: phosphatidylserine decarboxylase family protein [Desulfobacteraceae bacterium]|nr:phosphatidylserine decarboxylase family protein [Desulfobacteraceae bacterium]
MEFEVFASSLALALVFLPLLAWKWRIKMKIAIAGAVVIGGLTGFIVSWIDSLLNNFGMAQQVFIELFFILLMTFLAIILRFYRNPERVPLETEKVILSPADGKVIYVKEIEKGSTLVSTKGEKRFELKEIMATDSLDDVAYLIGIDMNFLNVHVNRSPIGGKIILQKQTKGKFLSLRRQESDILNERVTTIIDSEVFRIGVTQIASRLVRRIVSYLKEGDVVRIGDRIGAIIFGSQVDVAIPKIENLKIDVKPGDEVIAAISVIARYG